MRLVLETVNGMAKTAPMTDRQMREASDGSAWASLERRMTPAERMGSTGAGMRSWRAVHSATATA